MGGPREYELYEGTRIIYKYGNNWKNYDLHVRFFNEDNDGVSVIFGYKDGNDFYRVISVADGTNGGPFIALQKRENDAYITLDRKNISYEPGKEQTLDIKTKDGTIKVYLNGKLVLEGQGNVSGTFGLGSYANQGLCFREIKKALIKNSWAKSLV